MSDIPQIWRRIEHWLAEHAPEALVQLRPGASPTAIERAEAKLKAPLLPEYRASVLVHDGSANPSIDHGLMEGYVLYSLEKVLKTRELLRELDKSSPPSQSQHARALPAPGVRQAWWDDGWIAIAGDTMRDLVCIDTVPAPGGTVGQLVRYISDTPDRDLIAPSFGAWLARVATNLEGGELVADRDSDGDLTGFKHRSETEL